MYNVMYIYTHMHICQIYIYILCIGTIRNLNYKTSRCITVVQFTGGSVESKIIDIVSVVLASDTLRSKSICQKHGIMFGLQYFAELI